jgi:hypothetical protein
MQLQVNTLKVQRQIGHTLNVGRNKLKVRINQCEVSEGVASLSSKIGVASSLICPGKLLHPGGIQQRVDNPRFSTLIYAIFHLENE